MAVNFRQTDLAAPCGNIAACSGGSLGASVVQSLLLRNGTAGAVEQNGELTASATGIFAVFEVDPNTINYEAGNWVVRLNVTTAANINWTETHVCRVNSGCTSQGTIGSLTGQSTSLNSTGVKSMTVSGSADNSAVETDKVYIVCIGQNQDASTSTVGITPDQLIDTPLNIPDERFFENNTDADYVQIDTFDGASAMKNSTSLAYFPGADTLLQVDFRGFMQEFDRVGNLVASRITLTGGTSDGEIEYPNGICYIGDWFTDFDFAILDRGDGANSARLHLFPFATGQTSLSTGDVTTYQLPKIPTNRFNTDGDVGGEGVAYDPDTGKFYVVGGDLAEADSGIWEVDIEDLDTDSNPTQTLLHAYSSLDISDNTDSDVQVTDIFHGSQMGTARSEGRFTQSFFVLTQAFHENWQNLYQIDVKTGNRISYYDFNLGTNIQGVTFDNLATRGDFHTCKDRTEGGSPTNRRFSFQGGAVTTSNSTSASTSVSTTASTSVSTTASSSASTTASTSASSSVSTSATSSASVSSSASSSASTTASTSASSSVSTTASTSVSSSASTSATTVGPSGISISFEVSRVAGVCPIGVVVSMAGTTSGITTQPRHDLKYRITFGDEKSDTSRFGRQENKNFSYDPEGVHVYEDVGVYTITMEVWDELGNYAVETQQIDCLDPWGTDGWATVYSVNAPGDSDFTGAQAEVANQLNLTYWSDLQSLLADDVYIEIKADHTLLAEGNTDSSTGRLAFTGINKFHLTSYGNNTDSDRALVDANSVTDLLTYDATSSDIRVTKLNFNGNHSCDKLVSPGRGDTFLMHECQIDDFYRKAFDFPTTHVDYSGNVVSEVDVSMSDDTTFDSNARDCLYSGGKLIGIVDCHFNNNYMQQRCVRFNGGLKVIATNSLFEKSGIDYSTFRFWGSESGGFADFQYGTISGNDIRPGYKAQSIDFASTNGLRQTYDVNVTRNYISTPVVTTDFDESAASVIQACRGMLFENNVVNLTNNTKSFGNSVINADQQNTDHDAMDFITVRHNTIYDGYNRGGFVQLVTKSEDSSSLRIINNLHYEENGKQRWVDTGQVPSATIEGNVDASSFEPTDMWVNTSGLLDEFEDFDLNVGHTDFPSGIVDSGVPTQTFRDGLLRTREVNNHTDFMHDVGAFESNPLNATTSISTTASTSISTTASTSMSSSVSSSASSSVSTTKSTSASTSASTTASTSASQSTSVSTTASTSASSSASTTASTSMSVSTSNSTTASTSASSTKSTSVSTSDSTTASTSASSTKSTSVSTSDSTTASTSASSTKSTSVSTSGSTTKSTSASTSLTTTKSTSMTSTESTTASTSLSTTKSTTKSTTASTSMSSTASTSASSSISTTASSSMTSTRSTISTTTAPPQGAFMIVLEPISSSELT